MKRCSFVLVVAALACVFLIAACEHSSDNAQHTDSAYLAGTWESANSKAYTFTIQSDLSFECVILNPAMGVTSKAKISGKLDANASGLGPDDYLLSDLQTTGDSATYPGNTIPSLMNNLPGMNNITITLTPKENNTRFTFTSTNALAQLFFGIDGEFIKQPQP